jgi:hypothetical protein
MPYTLAAPFIVEAGAEDIFTESGANCAESCLSAGRIESAEGIGCAAKVHVEIFGFDGPVARQHSFDSPTEGPSSLRCTCAVGSGKAVDDYPGSEDHARLANDIAAAVDFTVGEAARSVNQDRSSGVAETSPNQSILCSSDQVENVTGKNDTMPVDTVWIPVPQGTIQFC